MQVYSTDLDDLSARMANVEEVLKVPVAKVDVLTPQMEGKCMIIASCSGEESSKEREGEKSTTGKKTSERSSIGQISTVVPAATSGWYVGAARPSSDGGGRSIGGGIFLTKLARLEFLKFAGEDPGSWFHLEGEANQWWQLLKRAYKDTGEPISWGPFSQELWERFGPTEGERCDEALSRIRQTRSLCDYQKAFEKLANRCVGWTQQALVGTYLRGLKSEIANEIKMFTPQPLRDAISLARMKNDQVQRHKPTGTSAPPAGGGGGGATWTGGRAYAPRTASSGFSSRRWTTACTGKREVVELGGAAAAEGSRSMLQLR
ncbi:unnamed protein product [Linum trigynum]